MIRAPPSINRANQKDCRPLCRYQTIYKDMVISVIKMLDSQLIISLAPSSCCNIICLRCSFRYPNRDESIRRTTTHVLDHIWRRILSHINENETLLFSTKISFSRRNGQEKTHSFHTETLQMSLARSSRSRVIAEVFWIFATQRSSSRSRWWIIGTFYVSLTICVVQ